MKKVKFIIWTILLSVVCLNCFSQYKKNAIVLELAGKSFGYFDISYERYLSERFHFGGGIGMAGRSQLYYDGGMFHRYNFRTPLYGAYTFGQRKHHLISEFGTSISWFTGPNGTVNFDGQFLFISFGYEYKGEKFVFRAPVYLAYVGSNNFMPPVMPWFGLSFGKLF
jgi:hypothetical protein